VKDHLRAARAALSPTLVSDESYRRLLQVGAAFPPNSFLCYGIESPLGHEATEVDVSVILAPGREVLPWLDERRRDSAPAWVATL
jgi:hypothetical protein